MTTHWRILKPTVRKNCVISVYLLDTWLYEKVFGYGEAKGSGHGF